MQQPASTAAVAPVVFGAITSDVAHLDAFEAAAGKGVGLFGTYASFYYDPNFNTAAANAVRSKGAVPMVTWEPWDPRYGVDQPNYSLARIASGAHDAYLTRWASQIANWGGPLWLRFAHEMNANWYPWAEQVNGNRPGDYVAAWRHVHDVFKRAGADNVTWVWSPNVEFPGSTSLATLYPGDAYVDWVGIDGYNWGTTQSWSSWQSPSQVFGATLGAVRTVSSKPVVIAEVGSAEAGGDKAAWIASFFTMVEANPAIRGFVWFNIQKETDWRIESSASAQRAFATEVADSRYR